MTCNTSAPVPSGSQSTLELRVNGVLWKETEHFFGLAPNARRYVLRRDDQGKTTIVLGDGNTGQRPPYGFRNLRKLSERGAWRCWQPFRRQSQPAGVPAPVVSRGSTQPVPAMRWCRPKSARDALKERPQFRAHVRTHRFTAGFRGLCTFLCRGFRRRRLTCCTLETAMWFTSPLLVKRGRPFRQTPTTIGISWKPWNVFVTLSSVS